MPRRLLAFLLQKNSGFCWKMARMHFRKSQVAGNEHAKNRHDVLRNRWRIKGYATDKAIEAFANEMR